ncbi:LOW QUALITY PROTEIN: interferon gamma receptor 2 [Corvus cornix cornix]|uniref:LOW QUALITY PROTEIN: interferon gamma receptor 2 n=1 Tax=Corvus cornix cornix TaxID=932674 RepID=UPI0019523784|nr:LOW QUALITY PROTEIN: interferon gamma receptor 2 [Corvus cornix cornix]
MRGRAPLRSLLLLLFLLGSARAAAAEPSPHLPAPKDVEVYSYNFQSLLRWSPVPVENSSVLYTAHYRTGFYEEWSEMGCTQTPQTQCEFPPQIRRRRWTILLRVRAELGPLTSAWVHTPPFVAERNTSLGPPKVNSVSVSPDSLFVSVSPPFTPETEDILHYHVSYWENTTSPTEEKLSESKTLFQIGNLKESTLYCFSIQVQLEIYSGHFLEGQQSAPECHRTALSEATRAGKIILLFVMGLVILNLVATGLLFLWKHHQKIKHWSQPPLQIPSHFEEFLRDPALAGLEELHSPAEGEPQAVEVGEGGGPESEGPPPHPQGQGSH